MFTTEQKSYFLYDYETGFEINPKYSNDLFLTISMWTPHFFISFRLYNLVDEKKGNNRKKTMKHQNVIPIECSFPSHSLTTINSIKMFLSYHTILWKWSECLRIVTYQYYNKVYHPNKIAHKCWALSTPVFYLPNTVNTLQQILQYFIAHDTSCHSW